MPVLSEQDRELMLPLLQHIRQQLELASEGDKVRLHSMRRYIAKRLEFDERGNPAQRRKLHERLWKRQHGICALWGVCETCTRELPERGSELDRLSAVDGYTEDNCRLVHHDCHRAAQAAKGFA